jgi:hypothetical protein
MSKMCPYCRNCYRLRQGPFRCPLAHHSEDIQLCHGISDLEAGDRNSSVEASPASASAGPPAATKQCLLPVFSGFQLLEPPDATALLRHPVLGDIPVPEPPAATAQSSQLSDEPSDSTQSIPGMLWWFDLEEWKKQQREADWVLTVCVYYCSTYYKAVRGEGGVMMSRAFFFFR